MATLDAIKALPDKSRMRYVRVPWNENSPERGSAERAKQARNYNIWGHEMEFNRQTGPRHWTELSHPLVTTIKPINQTLGESDYSGVDNLHADAQPAFEKIVVGEILPATGPGYATLAMVGEFNATTKKGERDAHSVALQMNAICQMRVKEDLEEALLIAIELGKHGWDRNATE